MVPFYGQGLNCGLEDVRVLSTLLDSEGVEPYVDPAGASRLEIDRRLHRALERYSEGRYQDLLAICDLAMDNLYVRSERNGAFANRHVSSVEMRHSVTTVSYMAKKTLDNVLYSLTSGMVNLSSLRPTLSRVPFPSENPKGWLPLYTMITFRPDISYATAKRKAERQVRIMEGLGWAGATLLGVAGIWAVSLVRQTLRR